MLLRSDVAPMRTLAVALSLAWAFTACGAGSSPKPPAPSASGRPTSAVPSSPPLSASITVVDGNVERITPAGTVLLAPPEHLAFSRDGTSVLMVDASGVDEWSVATKSRARRVPFPRSTDGPRGIFRTATQTFVLARDVYRLVAAGFEPAGSSYVRRPRAFTRKNGSTVVCFSDSGAHCQLHSVIGPDQKDLGELAWPFIVPLSGGRGFLEGLYQEGGLDLGATKLVKSADGARLPLDETWLRDVELWWATPSEDGAVIVTTEGSDRTHRSAFVRRVLDHGLAAPCSIGSLRPSQDAALALAPDGKLAAIPVRGGDDPSKGAVLFLDVDRCSGHRIDLPARALGVDFSPDGQSLAIGLSDSSLAVVRVPR